MLELRPFQKQALDALSTPGHVLCVAPTGSGKSLVYERASMRPGRRTLLVTPLVALGRQQRQRLNALGAQPATFGAEGPPSGSGVWIISPETLLHDPGARRVRQWEPDFLVVDECHCLWEWGRGFRPAFREIPPLLRSSRLGSSLWLTATLPRPARNELRAVLPPPLREIGAFDLPPTLDLRAVRVPWAERPAALVGWIAQQRGPGIVFAPTRESVHRLERLIQAAGMSALAYHAGMGAEERRAAEARILSDPPRAVVATSAFGMGMDCPALRWAVLWQAPPSLLALAQAIGRVGRDFGRRAHALVLWDEDDFRALEWMGHAEQLALTRGFLASGRCRREGLRSYFAEGLLVEGGGGPARCGLCDCCEGVGA